MVVLPLTRGQRVEPGMIIGFPQGRGGGEEHSAKDQRGLNAP